MITNTDTHAERVAKFNLDLHGNEQMWPAEKDTAIARDLLKLSEELHRLGNQVLAARALDLAMDFFRGSQAVEIDDYTRANASGSHPAFNADERGLIAV